MPSANISIASPNTRLSRARTFWDTRTLEFRFAIKGLLTILMIAAAGYGDFISGAEFSFSIFYLAPVTYAAWAIDTRSGAVAAMICAAVWLAVELKFVQELSHPFIHVWNGTVRLVFFGIGVYVVHLVKRHEARLRHDISQSRRHLLEEVQKRSQLEIEILEISSREQVRMAQDLHDGLGQYLSALAFHARMLTDDLRLQHSPHTEQAERIVALIRTTNQTIRQLDRVMRVPDQGGLNEAIRSLVARFHQLTGIHCDLQLAEIPIALEHFKVLMLFRIVQEALNNAVKHAHPRSIKISVSIVDRELHTCVSDDGFGLTAALTAQPGSGMGIMKLRAELIGGRLTIHPNVNSGCTVECVLPLPIEPAIPDAI